MIWSITFCVGDDLLVLVLGDVSGKGAAAALMMARTHALFRGIAGRSDATELFRSPERAVHQVNTILARGNSQCMFVTFLIAVFDGATNTLTYVRAGHLPPLLRRPTGEVHELGCLGGPPLGLLNDAVLHVRQREPRTRGTRFLLLPTALPRR